MRIMGSRLAGSMTHVSIDGNRLLTRFCCLHECLGGGEAGCCDLVRYMFCEGVAGDGGKEVGALEGVQVRVG